MTARLGMSAAQAGLNLTGHNLTNSATVGYTRQRIDQVSLNTGGNYRYASAYNGNIGNGVLITGTSQLRDSFLDLRYRNEVANVGYENVKNNVLNDLADILDEVKNASDDALSGGGIFNQLGDILEKLQQLSNQVGNKEFDSMVKTSCQQLTTLFNSYSARIDEVKDNLTDDLTNVDIPRVNEILKNISELNKTIKSSEIYGESALELKDQRNLLIDELAQYMKINVKYTPVQISDSTTIEELSITMENYDPKGKDYTLIDGEQYRQLICEQDKAGDWNITLSAMKVDCNPPQKEAVDPDIAAALEATKNSLQKLIDQSDPYQLVNTFSAAYTAYDNALTEYNNKKTEFTDAEAAFKTAQQNWQAADAELTKARQDLSKLQSEKADDDDIKAKIEEINEKQEALTEANKKYAEARQKMNLAEAAVKPYQNACKEAQTAYNEALANLPKDLTKATKLTINADGTVKSELVDLTQTDGTYQGFVNANNQPFYELPKTVTPTKITAGGNAVEEKLATAKTKYENAQAAYNKSAQDSAAITDDAGDPIIMNDIFCDGKLRGTLDMLNKEGSYADSDVRGIGYYQNMLDTLANTFANEMNKLNGDGRPLFTTKDGNTEGITAGNIQIATDWVNNTYGVTATTQKDPMGNLVEGANDNILRFIQLFDTDITYTTGLDNAKVGETYLDTKGNPVFLDSDGKVVQYDTVKKETIWKDKDGNEIDLVAKGYEEKDGTLVDKTSGDPIPDVTSEVKYTPMSVTTDPITETELPYDSLRTVKSVFTGTFEEAFTNIGTMLGLDIKGTSENLDNYELLASNLAEEREAVTGVNLDEEAMAIMQYSQSYNAAARLMTALDEMLETLITGTGKAGR